MKVTIFTCNQPRHISLVQQIAAVVSEVTVVQEVSTIFPGQVADFFKKSAVMQEYFGHVLEAEAHVFGRPRFLSGNVHHLAIRSGDINSVPLEWLREAMDADLYLVFGGSFIKGALCDFLVDKRALNIHMGVSPFYRGSSCNFWALYDNRPEYVGATVHQLSTGLDSGPILFHAFPQAGKADGFLLGMLAVRAAHDALVEKIRNQSLSLLNPVVQNRSHLIRYTRNAEFTDEVAAEYLKRRWDPAQIAEAVARRSTEELVNPVVLSV